MRCSSLVSTLLRHKGRAWALPAHFNTNGNDQTITRFGWKAQDKSLLLFAGEAANVEMGVTNELFPNERIPSTSCDVHQLPEDTTNIVSSSELAANSAGGDTRRRFLRHHRFRDLHAAQRCSQPMRVRQRRQQPTPGAALCTPLTSSRNAASIDDGHQRFRSVGCGLCHTETLKTGPSPFASLSNATYHPFSDLAVHNMGKNLADGVVQGTASGDEFRTAPLWGIGQRIYFLHDGRTNDLLSAIAAHMSPGSRQMP